MKKWMRRMISAAGALVLLLAGCVLFAQARNDAAERTYEEGEQALKEHRYADAEQAYEKLRRLAPGTAEVYGKLGVIYFQDSKFEQAVPVLREGLKLKPSLPNADILLAMCLSETGQFSEALPGLEKGFRKSAGSQIKRMAGLELERSYTGLRRDDDAVEVAVELGRLYPDDPEILYEGGRLFDNFAYLEMKKLKEVAPESVWRYQSAGEASEAAGNYDSAAADYRKVLELNPRRPGTNYRLGRALLARARQPDAPADLMAEALKAFEQEIEVDPANASAAYEAAEIHRRAEEFDQARPLFEAALRYQPDFEEAQVGLGKVLMDTHHADLAAPYLRRAVVLEPGDRTAWFRLSQAERELGNAAEAQHAMAQYQYLVDHGPNPHITGGVPWREVTQQELDSKAASGPDQ